jgi:chromosome segregation ATPase
LHNQRSPRKAPATPLKNNQNILNLLDFELPPAPTPRSIPTISIRELESLKSEFASQVSSLKASLSGRDAEVEALKRAVSDAERRVGEAAEEAREEKSRREAGEKEREEWERRGREFENVLKKVKLEVLEAERERGELAARADDAEERLRDAEAKAAEAEARAAKAESSKITAAPVAEGSTSSMDGTNGPLFTAEQVQKQIDEKIHTLSTELHAIYKKKHLTKVAGLKKGFEAKTREKATALEARIATLEAQNDELQAKLDATFSGVLPLRNEQRDADRKRADEQAALIERQKAELAGKDEELKTRQTEFAGLMRELEQERVEKGELVAAVDEMLALQADVSVLGAAAAVGTNVSESRQQQASVAAAAAAEDVLRKSVGLGGAVRPPTGLARPGFGFGAGAGQSRIAAPGSGLAKGGSLGGAAGKSRMMSNIERMGGRAVE